MITEEKVIARVMKMYDESARNHLHERLNRVLHSGAINLESYEDNHLLPKILIHVLFEELSFQFKPLTTDSREEAKNLRYFV